jgi:organic radical activating enzyme
MSELIVSDGARTRGGSKEDRLKHLEELVSLSDAELLAIANSSPHPITEQFYSFQGEGARLGRPVYFVRYSKCNFRCEWCDSKRTWQNGDTQTADQLLANIEESPAQSVVITGGEPMLYRYKDFFVAFILLLKRRGYYIEVESDAALPAPPVLIEAIDHWNLSPKLGSSGIKMTDKYAQAIEQWVEYRNAGADIWFKFVVMDSVDYAEVQAFEERFGVKRDRIFLMPEGNTIVRQMETMPYVVDRCLVGGYNFSPRAHILVWNDKEAV